MRLHLHSSCIKMTSLQISAETITLGANAIGIEPENAGLVVHFDRLFRAGEQSVAAFRLAGRSALLQHPIDPSVRPNGQRLRCNKQGYYMHTSCSRGGYWQNTVDWTEWKASL